jgi:hypothetical protein
MYLNYVFLIVIWKDFGFFEYNLEWSSSENSGSRMFFTYVLSSKNIDYQVRDLESGRKANLWWAFLACFSAKLYVYYDYLAMSKSPNQLPNYLKRAKTSVVIIVFSDVLYHVLWYCYLFLPSTLVRYQKSYILVSERI